MSYQEVRINDEAARADSESGIYTRHYKLKPSDLVLDIGAHIGCFSKWAAPQCSRIIAFEPEHYNFSKLVLNTHEFENVTCINAAASDHNSPVFLNINTRNSGGHGLFRNNQHDAQVTVQAVDIGSFLSGTAVDFAKIDAEDSEFHILMSFWRAEKRFPMAVEVHSHPLYEKCAWLLRQQGYKILPEENTVGVCYAIPQ